MKNIVRMISYKDAVEHLDEITDSLRPTKTKQPKTNPNREKERDYGRKVISNRVHRVPRKSDLV